MKPELLAELPRPMRDEKMLASLRAIDAQQKIEGFTGPLTLEVHYLDGDPQIVKIKHVVNFRADLTVLRKP